MTDLTQVVQAKSDQLNAVDLAANRIIKITAVDTNVNRQQQPTWIYFEGDNGRPWKPSKGMLRILMQGWGKDDQAFVGKYAEIFCNPEVVYAGKEVGGIQIKAMSDIDKNGFKTILVSSKTKRNVFHVEHLEPQTTWYDDAKFQAALPAMQAKMQSGEMTLQQVISRLHQSGQLTPEQYAALEAVAPKPDLEVDNDAE